MEEQAKKTSKELMQERIMKLEMAVVMLMNGLRVIDKYPTGILDKVEKLITSG
jgi:hypothetical protein